MASVLPKFQLPQYVIKRTYPDAASLYTDAHQCGHAQQHGKRDQTRRCFNPRYGPTVGRNIGRTIWCVIFLFLISFLFLFPPSLTRRLDTHSPFTNTSTQTCIFVLTLRAFPSSRVILVVLCPFFSFFSKQLTKIPVPRSKEPF